MALVDRARNMILQPAAEWPIVAMEPATPASLYTGYIIPLALIGPVCAFISQAVFFHHPVVGIAVAALTIVLELAYVFIIALIAAAIAPSFNGVPDRMQALKWIAYGYTARWVAGVAQLIPILGALVVLVASLYSLYTLYIGAVPMMRLPQEKAIGYVVVLVLCVIVLGIIIGVLVGIVTAAVLLATGATTGLLGH